MRGNGNESVIHATMNEFLLEFNGFYLSLVFVPFFCCLLVDAGTSINDDNRRMNEWKSE